MTSGHAERLALRMGAALAVAFELLFLAGGARAASVLGVAETSPLVVVGEVGAVAKIDVHGYRARLRVEAAVAGEAGAGDELTVGWEELSPSRPPRFADGDRVLLCLQPLPSDSLWTKRFAGEGASVFVVASGGEAFLRQPQAEAEALRVYLALPPPSRRQAAGARALAGLARFDSPLALEAIVRLGGADAAAFEDAEATALLAQIAMDEHRSRAVRAAVIDLAAARHVSALRPALQRLAQPRGDVEAEALSAIAALDGGMDPSRAAALLQRREAEVRAVGARWMRGPGAQRELPAVARADPSPLVRRTAATTLAESGTAWGMEAAVASLADGDATVRTAAAQAVARRGAAAVPFLEAALRRQDVPAAAGAILALSLMGRPGRELLVSTAAHHPDEKIRALAQLALGRAPGNGH